MSQTRTETEIDQWPEADLFAESLPLLKESSEFITSNHTQLKYARKAKRVSLQRYLVSKIVHDFDNVSFQDLLVLFDNLLWLQDKAASDPQFNEKFSHPLKVLTKLLKELKINQRTYKRTLRKLRKRFIEELESFYFAKRNYPQIKQRNRDAFRFIMYVPDGTKTSDLPQKLYVGKGYSDKGTARNPALDGSPSWQDVAMFSISETTIVINEED